jgi:hypothetical protein
MRQDVRNQLGAVLTPVQLEEYLLRYSQTANDLRAQLGKLKFFNATPEEFRNIFRADDSFNQQIQMLGNGTDPITVAQRNSLEQQRDNAVRLAIGPARFLQYQKLQDPLYQQATATAIQNGDPNSADTIYAINLTAQSEQTAIKTDTSLTDSQRALAQKQLELDQLTATTAASGQPLLPEPPPVPPRPVTLPHVIGQTENANGLSKLFGISIDTIQALNPSIDVNNLRPGDVIRLPQPPPTRVAPQLLVPQPIAH